MDILLDGLSMRPEKKNTLTRQYAVYKQCSQGPATFDLLHGILPQLRAMFYNCAYVYVSDLGI